MTEPVITAGASTDGTCKFILNVSSPSTMSSSITFTLTVVLVAPAGIVTLREEVLKSLPTYIKYGINSYSL